MLHLLGMRLSEVRKRYLTFMRSCGHQILPSASLVPTDDSTTLFTGSGMQPLVPYLLGQDHQRGARLADSQKCFRANDIDEVGDNRHTTFFEMLGNWSLGDYFKEEQIQQCFTFLTDPEIGLGLVADRLYVTVFSGDSSRGIPRDDEAAEIWRRHFADVGIDARIAHIGSQEDGDRRGMQQHERIFFYDAGKNWWSRSGPPESMPPGEPGGPDTEVFYDFGEECADPSYSHLRAHPNSDSGRFVELCNSVFMEYCRTEDSFVPLPRRNVDFGGGLERLAAVTEGTADIFCIDVFQPCIEELSRHTTLRYAEDPKPFRVVADHLRSALFIIADGVVPSTTDRGYVLRRLLRESLYNVRYVLRIPEEVSLSSLLELFVPVYLDQYPEVAAVLGSEVVRAEEQAFSATLQRGVRLFESIAARGSLTGEDVFVLQSTYGFPKELSVMLAEQRKVPVSLDGYDEAMQQHQASSRSGGEKRFKGGLADTSEKSVQYHTATHLLHQALRDVLGDSVLQRGSNITPERLRFDFAYGEKMTDEQLSHVEALVNEQIDAGLPVHHQDMPLAEAEKLGAIGLFEYTDPVRVYRIGEYSTEYCGGPHVENTAELGAFRIVKEESVAAGVRRIKAVLA